MYTLIKDDYFRSKCEFTTFVSAISKNDNDSTPRRKRRYRGHPGPWGHGNGDPKTELNEDCTIQGTVPQFDSVQLVNITTITRVYHTYNYSIHGVYKPTNITGGHHLVWTSETGGRTRNPKRKGNQPVKPVAATWPGWWFLATPLKNDGVRQLGWWDSQYMGK